MLPLSVELIARERQRDLYRESEEDRLIRQARPIRKRSFATRRLVASLGSQMVRWGTKLQTYGGVPPSQAVQVSAVNRGC